MQNKTTFSGSLKPMTSPSSVSEDHAVDKRQPIIGMTLAALGIVYGDIGTSPLYALRECFHGHHALPLTPTNVLGILSLILWSLILVISIKYLIFVLRADNRGEGGILALMALVQPRSKMQQGGRQILLILGLFGAALLYGDGAITPAISVLSAVEGLKVATPFFEPYITPITLLILYLLFMAQKRGTASLGSVFGPIILLWFISLAALGVNSIWQNLAVLEAINPIHAVHFMLENGWYGFMSLGVVFLVVTGGEALYADMGHFGKKPIRAGWFYVVLPALICNYFGQGALLLRDPTAAVHPFFKLAPSWALYPLVALATLATVIASQALISGAYSMTSQAVQLGFLPRIAIKHTSKAAKGQIYVPFVNWLLLAATIMLVLLFKTSSNLAAAYGVAVTTTMVITTVLMFFVARDLWKWSSLRAGIVLGCFLIIDLGYFSANMMKIFQGGWFPLFVGIGILLMMTTWYKGRQILAARLRARLVSLDDLKQRIAKERPYRVSGTAVYMTSVLHGAPPALVHNLRHNKVLHDTVVLMKVQTEEVPHVLDQDRIELENIEGGLYKIVVKYGFMDTPNIPNVLQQCAAHGLELDPLNITYFLGSENLLATSKPGMAIWRENLFAFMSRNAQRATAFFRLPPNQVIEIGLQVEL